jgi:hypothetical protein
MPYIVRIIRNSIWEITHARLVLTFEYTRLVLSVFSSVGGK